MNQGFSNYFCLMIEESGSIPLTSGPVSGSGRPGMMWIRIRNTDYLRHCISKYLYRHVTLVYCHLDCDWLVSENIFFIYAFIGLFTFNLDCGWLVPDNRDVPGLLRGVRLQGLHAGE